MIAVRRCENRLAFAAFILPFCIDDFKAVSPSLPLTPEIIEKATASWEIVEFFDTEKGVIVGATAREPNHHVHLYVDPERRASWRPHTSLQGGLDIFLSASDTLYAAIPVANKVTISIVRKLGFLPTRTENGIAFHVLTSQTRKTFRKDQGRR
jgi:hypothetical protein